MLYCGQGSDNPCPQYPGDLPAADVHLCRLDQTSDKIKFVINGTGVQAGKTKVTIKHHVIAVLIDHRLDI